MAKFVNVVCERPLMPKICPSWFKLSENLGEAVVLPALPLCTKDRASPKQLSIPLNKLPLEVIHLDLFSDLLKEDQFCQCTNNFHVQISWIYFGHVD